MSGDNPKTELSIVIAAYNEAQEKGLGVVSLGSKMIDAPVVQRALKLMARAQAMEVIE